jgi:hypothetical protein
VTSMRAYPYLKFPFRVVYPIIAAHYLLCLLNEIDD